MNIAAHLSLAADEFEAEFKPREVALEAEMAALRKKMKDVEAVLETVRMGHKRRLEFSPSLGGKFQCPRCWVLDGVRANLKPSGGGTNVEDFMCCSECDHEYSIPV
jgi:hypothetical protein